MGKNLTDPFCGFLKNKRFMIHDRDRLYTDAFVANLKAGGIEPIKTMPMAPNFSPFIKTFHREGLFFVNIRFMLFQRSFRSFCFDPHFCTKNEDSRTQSFPSEASSFHERFVIFCHSTIPSMMNDKNTTTLFGADAIRDVESLMTLTQAARMLPLVRSKKVIRPC